MQWNDHFQWDDKQWYISGRSYQLYEFFPVCGFKLACMIGSNSRWDSKMGAGEVTI